MAVVWGLPVNGVQVAIEHVGVEQLLVVVGQRYFRRAAPSIDKPRQVLYKSRLGRKKPYASGCKDDRPGAAKRSFAKRDLVAELPLSQPAFLPALYQRKHVRCRLPLPSLFFQKL
jgi:hypothetical protein